jgi:taurine dioxygenase
MTPVPVIVVPVAGALGATVTGIDLSAVQDSDALDGVRQALAEHLVVFFPEQHLTLDDLERLTDLLGGRDATPYVTPLAGRPYVIRSSRNRTTSSTLPMPGIAI